MDDYQHSGLDRHPEQKNSSSSNASLIRYILVAAILFGLGWAGGSGRLHLNEGGITKPKSSKSAIDYSSVNEVYSYLKKDFDGTISDEKILDGLKEGLAKSTGDQYTEYFNAEEAKAFDDQLSGSFEGIGAELGKDKDNIVVISPLSGYPADKAGLKPKDIIAKIDGKSTFDMTIGDAVKQIRGPKNTTVKLTVVRGDGPAFDVSITRSEINIPSVEYKVDGNIGYMKISQFGPDTVDLATKAAHEFKDKNVGGVVVDLRGNPGGYLNGAIDVSSLWLKSNQKVVEERRGGKTFKTSFANNNAVLAGMPTVVLIDGGSASASEITAGALRDNNAAQLIGQKSYGKGSVQQIERLSGGAEIKITIARWYTPSGHNIDKEGITPDVKVDITDEEIKAGKDVQKDKAYEIVRSKI